MFKYSIPALLCSLAPAVVFAEPVELRSSDKFISVEGEIVGFDGVMLSVETSVGRVSVPASEVVCFGAGCLSAIAGNDFGLTADAFEGVEAAEVAVSEALSDDFVVSVNSPEIGALYRAIAGAFAVASETTANVDLGSAGQIDIQNESGNETAKLGLAADGGSSDIRIGTLSLRGSADTAFSGPVGWATAPQLPNQLLGLKAFAVVVAPNVNIDAISLEQLADIYAGEITNWSQLGGSDLTVLPLQLPVNSAVRDEMIKVVMQPAGKSIAPNVLTMANEAAIAGSVGQLPGSVSVVSLNSIQENQPLPISDECGPGVQANPFNIASGDYPLIRPVMVSYDRTPNTSLPTELFDFAATDLAQGLMAREGFVNYSGIKQEVFTTNTRINQLLTASHDDIERPAAAQMFETLFGAVRLSPTMSGGVASGPESAWNRAMINDLVELLDDPEYDGKEVSFAGFGTSENGSQAAIDASAQAAAEVQAAFEQLASGVIGARDLTLLSYGFGNVSKVTCIGGQVRGPSHSRVEIWVR